MVVRVCITVDAERRKRDPTFHGIDDDLDGILDTLRPLCKATFFVTGEVAENLPGIIGNVASEGHEVSCHGLHHERFDTMEPDEQFRRIELATRLIADASKTRPVGFRAPEHRANAVTINALEELGYVYDSSVLPRTPFMRPQARKKWRFLFAPLAPYFPAKTNIARRGSSRILELPCSTFILPFMSNVSMRSRRISRVLTGHLRHRSENLGAPIIYYLHSYDGYFHGDLAWLQDVIGWLRKFDVEFLTMNQLAEKLKGDEANAHS